MNDSEDNIIRTTILQTHQRSVTYLYRFFFLLLSASISLIFSCYREDMFLISKNYSGEKYAIGDTGPGGGIVFYITDGGSHGMEVATVDQHTGIQWRNGVDVTTGATGTGIGTGPANTNTIISMQGAVATDYAAGIAQAYNGGGKTDWFLPSSDELYTVWINLVNDGLGNNNGVGSFSPSGYWTSSEIDLTSVNFVSFFAGGTGATSKSNTEYVRAVRYF
jgi:hypothetical protein